MGLYGGRDGYSRLLRLDLVTNRELRDIHSLEVKIFKRHKHPQNQNKTNKNNVLTKETVRSNFGRRDLFYRLSGSDNLGYIPSQLPSKVPTLVLSFVVVENE